MNTDNVMPNPAPLGVDTAIQQVMARVAAEGIAKDRNNQQQGFKFRGIDDVYNAMAPMLATAGLLVIPSYTNRVVAERTTKSGGALFNVTVEGLFTFIAQADGSSRVAGPFFGEAMDSADKATNKAMSAAFKYCFLQTFCIPTEGDNDADGTTHDVAGKAAKPAAKAAAADPAPMPEEDFQAWLAAIAASATLADLSKAFKTAVTQARKVGDDCAIVTFTQKKDEKKATIEAAGAEA